MQREILNYMDTRIAADEILGDFPWQQRSRLPDSIMVLGVSRVGLRIEVVILTELQEKQVWDGMLGAEIRSDYFADFAGSYSSRQKAATLLTLLFSSGATVSLLTSLPRRFESVRLILASITAAISLYSFVMQNQKLAFNATDLHSRWNRVAKEYQRLWEDMYDPNAPSQLDALDDKASELSKTGKSFPNREKVMLRWTNRAISQHQAHA